MVGSRNTWSKWCPRDKNPQSWLGKNQLLPENQVPGYCCLAKLASITAQQISSARAWQCWNDFISRFYFRPILCNLFATAVMRAAPFPLPSSESMNVTSHWGASSLTVSCRTLEKLKGKKKKEHFRSPFPVWDYNIYSCISKEQ